MKNALLDFGAVGDNATDNAPAMAAAVAWINNSGGFVYWPRGLYRFNSPPPPIYSDGGGFVGDGPSMCYSRQGIGPEAGQYGTVFRANFAAGDFIRILKDPILGFATGFTIRDIGFWPVPFRTSGYEILDRGNHTLLENLHFAFVRGSVFFGAGCSGGVARHLRTFAIFGRYAYMFQGASPSLADWSQGIVCDDVHAYNPWPVREPINANTTAAWQPGKAYAAGDITIGSGAILQAVTPGTSAATAPIIPGFAYAGAPTATDILDGPDLRWHYITAANGACFNLDSNAAVITLRDCQPQTQHYGIIAQNTLNGIPPQSVKIVDCLTVNTIADGIMLTRGSEFTIRDTDLHYSALGRGMTVFGQFLGNLKMSGGHVWQNALDGLHLPTTPNGCIDIEGVRIAGNSVAAPNNYSGIIAPTGLSRFRIRGCHVGADFMGGATQKYGLNLWGGCDEFVITDNILRGNATAGLINGSGTGPTKIVANNL